MGETGKRSHHQKDNNGNGSNKNQRRRVDKEDKGGDELVAYRILCPDTVIGSVIGKAGKIINSIRQESRAKVKVVDPFPGAKERVITIYCYVNDKVKLDVDEEYTEIGPLCPAQDALLKMHAAIANAVTTLGDSENKQRECTLLVPASQSANLIGKSGATIKRLRSKTRSNVKVIPKDVTDPTHSMALDFDNFVQMTGDSEAVKKALFAVSAIIYKFPAREEIPLDTSVPEMPPSIIIPADLPIFPAGGFYAGADPMAPSRSAPSLIDAHASELPLQGYADAGSMWPVVVPNYGGASHSEELIIRVLCPSDIIGRVIGRAGSTIKALRQASGTHIAVDDSKPTKAKYNGCVITVTSTESLDDVQSKAVEAVLLLQEKINEDGENVTMCLLIPSRNIGCIIGKSGSIINEIRKRSRADIRISKGEKPKSADDEYVEVSGEVKNVRDALIQIVLRLRDDELNDKDVITNSAVATDHIYSGGGGFSVPLALQSVPPANHLGYQSRAEPGYQSRAEPGYQSRAEPGYQSRAEPGYQSRAEPGYQSRAEPGYQSRAEPGYQSRAEPGYQSRTEPGYQPRTESATGVGMLSSSNDFYKYGSVSMGDDLYGSSYSSKHYEGRSLPSSTLEMLIPANAMSKVVGKNGSNLANIRQLSGALIEMSELKTSHGDRVAYISGTAEQKRSAENLIQAFIMAT